MNCPNVRWSKIWTSSWVAFLPRCHRSMTWRKCLSLQRTRHHSSDINCVLLQWLTDGLILHYRKLPSIHHQPEFLFHESSYIWSVFLRKQTLYTWPQSSCTDPLRLATQLDRIVTRLNDTFKALASIKTDIMTDELDKDPKNPKLLAFLLLEF